MNRLRTAVRRWLGFDELIMRIDRVRFTTDCIENNLRNTHNLLAAQSSGLGRIIAKLDPMYGRSEHDPERKAESDAIGEAVMKKLLAEHHARQHQEGKA